MCTNFPPSSSQNWASVCSLFVNASKISVTLFEEGEIQRGSSEKTQHVNVRLIAATKRNLEQEVVAQTFRADLFERLNVSPLIVPPWAAR